MFYKNREKPKNLQLMESLNKRMHLTHEEYGYYLSLLKGYEGECRFDVMFVEKVSSDCLVLNDLLLKESNAVFQIDSLVVTGKKVLLYEVKNYRGQYVYQEDSWKMPGSNKVILNPLGQLNRTKTLLSQLLNCLGHPIPVEAYLVFVNPSFTLFQAPVRSDQLLPTMIADHFENLNKKHHSITKAHKELAKKLQDLDMSEAPHTTLPVYDFKTVEKGVFCSQCAGKVQKDIGRKQFCYCVRCGHKEHATDIILHCINEFRCLFPEQKITIGSIEKWCGFVFSRKRIRTVLNHSFKRRGSKRHTYYY